MTSNKSAFKKPRSLVAGKRPSIGWHYTLSVLAEGLAFVSFAFLAIIILPGSVRRDVGVFLALAFFGGSGFLAVWVTRFVLQHWSARCPQCGGQAFQEGIRQRRYTCQDCKYSSRTFGGTNS